MHLISAMSIIKLQCLLRKPSRASWHLKIFSFCGVGAHHQNGIAEKRIGVLQKRATTLLLHAQRRWPDAINSHLWTLQSEQQMIVGIMHQQMKMTHVQCQNSVTQQVCQKFKTNIILDFLYMYLERTTGSQKDKEVVR